MLNSIGKIRCDKVCAPFPEQDKIDDHKNHQKAHGLREGIFFKITIKNIIMKNILFIVGSLRKDSFNRQLAAEAEKYLAGQASVTYLDYTNVPFINQDIEHPAPAAVSQLRETVAQADGIWIFTPEYNFSYPGHLKNVLDWLSRPVVANDYATPTVINGKKVALSGAGGQMATGKCREKLTELLTFIKANVMTEPQTGITLNAEAWTEGRMILTDEQRAALKAQVDKFVAFVNEL